MTHKSKLLLNFLVVMVICLLPILSPHSSTISAKADFQPINLEKGLPAGDDFVPLNGSGIVSDDFNACDLNTSIWTFIDPLGDSSYAMIGTFSDNARISITAPSGTDHGAKPPANAPRVMQSANNTDFVLEAKLYSGMSGMYETMGIIVQQTQATDYLRFEFYSTDTHTVIYAASISGGVMTQRINSNKYSNNTNPLYLRVLRSTNDWTLYYSEDGVNWNSAGTFSHSLTVTAVGVYAGSESDSGDSSPGHTGEIDYFFNNASPISPEDGARNTLSTSVSPIGGGTVIKDPDSSNYACKEEVELTANPSSNYSFTDWSGDIISTTNPVTTTMTGAKTVTANFIREYTLDIDIIGNGTVEKDPDQMTYHSGDTVDLTANADPGWTFDDWSGDISSSTNPYLNFEITDDHVITATFTQDEYTLNVTTSGDGSVDVSPQQDTYHYGDKVILMATEDAGWSFTGWSGDLTGSDNPETITITGDTVIAATFTQGEYSLTVNEDGNGTVSVSPLKSFYELGDVVQLTATADPGWTFTGWSGDISGTANPHTLVMTGDKTVTATFTQDQYTLTVNVVGNGTVAADPDQSTYVYGEVVTLTATADPKHIFTGWSGDLSGSSNPTTVTIDNDKAISGTFMLNVDLTISITDGLDSIPAGDPTTYTIIVNNVGENPVVGATISNSIPLTVTNVTWSCTPSTGASCSASGSGNNLNDNVSLLAGTKVTYTVNGTIDSGASGLLENDTSVILPDGMTDVTPENNVDTDVTIILPQPSPGNELFLPLVSKD